MYSKCISLEPTNVVFYVLQATTLDSIGVLASPSVCVIVCVCVCVCVYAVCARLCACVCVGIFMILFIYLICCRLLGYDRECFDSLYMFWNESEAMADGRVLLLRQNISGEVYFAVEDNQPDDMIVAVDSIAPILKSAGVVANVDVFKVGECVFVFRDISA